MFTLKHKYPFEIFICKVVTFLLISLNSNKESGRNVWFLSSGTVWSTRLFRVTLASVHCTAPGGGAGGGAGGGGSVTDWTQIQHSPGFTVTVHSVFTVSWCRMGGQGGDGESGLNTHIYINTYLYKPIQPYKDTHQCMYIAPDHKSSHYTSHIEQV